MEYENAIEINNLVKKYDGFTLGEISFAVPTGSIMGFVGQNGSGKSTTIKSILNIIKNDSGEIKIFGLDHIKYEKEIKEKIAVVFDTLPFHESLNGKQINNIMKNMYMEWSEETFYGYLERFHLPVKKKLGEFSKGMKMKFQIATALSHNASLLIMDEATAGLDPVVRSEMLDVFMEFMQDETHSILMSSHITSDLERIADKLTFIHNGKIILSGYKDEILENHGIIQCSLDEIKEIDDEDIISIRTNKYAASIMVKNRRQCEIKYSGALIDNASLDDILLYYVKGMSKREWEE
ncbi:MAG: ABC transporter ATP-binding protein [Lachnospiraceae bacterium]|nr:ABC transporter ATP-binding protein [Lachnospiraceae bacterium]